jgi:hypothetical protein
MANNMSADAIETSTFSLEMMTRGFGSSGHGGTYTAAAEFNQSSVRSLRQAIVRDDQHRFGARSNDGVNVFGGVTDPKAEHECRSSDDINRRFMIAPSELDNEFV